MKKSAIAALLAIVSLAVPLAYAADKAAEVTDMQALRAAIKADKKAFVAARRTE